MEAKEVFRLLVSKLLDVEYMLFQWTGGGDDWSGFKFLKGKDVNGEFFESPEAFDGELLKALNECDVFDEMDFGINFTDQGWSEGVLLIALKPLKDIFEADIMVNDQNVYICQDDGFKGFALAGNNHNTQQSDLEF